MRRVPKIAGVSPSKQHMVCLKICRYRRLENEPGDRSADRPDIGENECNAPLANLSCRTAYLTETRWFEIKGKGGRGCHGCLANLSEVSAKPAGRDSALSAHRVRICRLLLLVLVGLHDDELGYHLLSLIHDTIHGSAVPPPTPNLPPRFPVILRTKAVPSNLGSPHQWRSTRSQQPL